jgi:hypothetical protein
MRGGAGETALGGEGSMWGAKWMEASASRALLSGLPRVGEHAVCACL